MSESEISIAIAFESEKVARYCSLPAGVLDERRNSVNWMLRVHDYYKFRPETAYLSIIYLDHFLMTHALPEDKAWAFQLLSVTCVSLAAKMEEINVPLLLDLQIMKPRFFFKPETIQRMELLVMASLNWRLRFITPFDFLHYFISKLTSYDHPQVYLFASDFIISTCKVVDFLDFSPSIIAAATVLWVTGQNVHEQNLNYFDKRVSKEMVERCYKLMEQKMGQMGDNIAQKFEQKPQNMVGMFDLAITRSLKCLENFDYSEH